MAHSSRAVHTKLGFWLIAYVDKIVGIIKAQQSVAETPSLAITKAGHIINNNSYMLLPAAAQRVYKWCHRTRLLISESPDI